MLLLSSSLHTSLGFLHISKALGRLMIRIKFSERVWMVGALGSVAGRVVVDVCYGNDGMKN